MLREHQTYIREKWFVGYIFSWQNFSQNASLCILLFNKEVIWMFKTNDVLITSFSVLTENGSPNCTHNHWSQKLKTATHVESCTNLISENVWELQSYNPFLQITLFFLYYTCCYIHIYILNKISGLSLWINLHH